MTLHQLRIFMAVAQSSTLTRASKQLGLAQPSLSQQLAKLEESVGTRLFDRSHNRMVLTDAGHLLYRYAVDNRHQLDGIKVKVQEFDTMRRGQVKIATDSFTIGYLVLAGALFLGGCIVLILRRRDPGN